MNSESSKISKILYTWLLVFILWLAFTATFDKYELISGIVISLFIALFTYQHFTVSGLKALNPIKLFYLIQYLGVFLLALIKSNFHVARIVLDPKLPINPGIVEFESKLHSEFAKMILANSITLTPGTLSVDVVDQHFYIHWLEVKSIDSQIAYNEIAKQFEDILLKIYN